MAYLQDENEAIHRICLNAKKKLERANILL